MGYLNEPGLARYDGLIKSWTTYDSGTVTGLAPLLNWQKTADAASVTCYPVPVSPLEPVVSFLFAETPPGDGNPKSPTNPSTITGVSSITVTRCETVGVDETQYTVDLGGTFYGGSVNFATGVMEVTHEKIIVDENLTYSSSLGLNETSTTYRLAFYPTKGRQKSHPLADRCCDLLTVDGVGDNTLIFGNNSYNIQISLSKSLLGLSDGLTYNDVRPVFSSFFGEHKMNIVYKLETPYTVPLTPVLVRSLPALSHYVPRQNTIYTSHESVQVGYAKSALKTSEELTNAIISLGGNV